MNDEVSDEACRIRVIGLSQLEMKTPGLFGSGGYVCGNFLSALEIALRRTRKVAGATHHRHGGEKQHR